VTVSWQFPSLSRDPPEAARSSPYGLFLFFRYTLHRSIRAATIRNTREPIRRHAALDKEQKLKAAELIDFFNEDATVWRELAQKSYAYVRGNFPADSLIRPDDVAKVLEPILEVNENLRDYLSENKLKQKYWVRDFTDLVIDRTWSGIATGDEANAKENK
jgi:hypothetical protein